MSTRLFCIYLLCTCFSVGLIFCPPLHARVTADEIAEALDFPKGVTFTSTNQAWSLVKKAMVQSISPKNILAHKGTYLLGKAPGQNDKQIENAASFSLTVRGAGELSFWYKVSLEDGNWDDDSKNSYLCAYEESFDFNDLLFHDTGFWWTYDYDDGEPYEWWWEEGTLSLGYEHYTHTVTFSLVGPAKTGYVKPVTQDEWDNKNKGLLYKTAWLDQFVWEPDDEPLLTFSPDPEFFNTFKDSEQISIDSKYENLVFYYTTNGDEPESSSALYDPDEGITIDNTTTIKVVAFEDGKKVSEVYKATYLRKTKEPEPLLEQEDMKNTAILSFLPTESGAVVYYTLNGQSPVRQPDNSPGENTFTEPREINGPVTASAMSWKEGLAESDVVSFTFDKLAKPGYSTSHPYLDEDGQGTLTINAPAGVTVKYQVDNGATETYTEPFSVFVDSTVSFQAQKEGMLHSDIVEFKFYKTDTPFELPPLDETGWSLFFLPGHVSQKSSDTLIAQLQPIAYDSQKKIYFRPTLLLGGESYWVFRADGETLNLEPFPIYPIEGVTLPAKTWLLSGTKLPLPEDVQVQTWTGKIFQPVLQAPADGWLPAWLYKQ